jgi:tryptophan synthase beta chain
MKGYFGEFGGQFVPETLLPALRGLEDAFLTASLDRSFWDEFNAYMKDYVGRPSPLTHAVRLSESLGIDVWLKREDLNHTGSHKINNAMGQILLARRMRKQRIIAETGAGQHGVATAPVCALFGLTCAVYMGTEDIERQKMNVERMRLLGAEVVPVTSGAPR